MNQSLCNISCSPELLHFATLDVGRKHVEYYLSLLGWESFYENLWHDLLTLPLSLALVGSSLSGELRLAKH